MTRSAESLPGTPGAGCFPRGSTLGPRGVRCAGDSFLPAVQGAGATGGAAGATGGTAQPGGGFGKNLLTCSALPFLGDEGDHTPEYSPGLKE